MYSRQSTAFSPQAGYRVLPVDRMSAGRKRMRRKNPRSQPFIDPDFTLRESRFKSMFALTAQPVSVHGVGTSPSAATHPESGRALNVVDGPRIRSSKRKRVGMVGAGKLVAGLTPRS